MKLKLIAIAMLLVGILIMSGCAAPQCYPPNEIIGNKCCMDSDGNGVCDMDEEIVEEPEPVAAPEPVTEPEPEPQIQQVAAKQAEPAEEEEFEYGKVMKMKIGETRQYITIDDWNFYRSSTDKGEMVWMIFTVKNIGKKTITPNVDLLFEGARTNEADTSVGKDYTIETLEPGEKITFKQSMGIRFAQIDKKKKITMRIYDRFSAPREYLYELVKEFTPSQEMDSLEIYIHGPPTD